jgi:hypothetical protein
MLAVVRRSVRPHIRRLGCGYHSYPDPRETPIVSETKSDHVKTIKKTDAPWSQEFGSLKKRFDMSKSFPGFEGGVATGPKTVPIPKSSTLANGLTVVSIESSDSTMASYAFLVKRGRYQRTISTYHNWMTCFAVEMKFRLGK